MVANRSFAPAILPSAVTTRMPSAVDSSVALTSESASRRAVSLRLRSVTSRIDATTPKRPVPVSGARLTSMGNSVPSRRRPKRSRSVPSCRIRGSVANASLMPSLCPWNRPGMIIP
ncbi:hypothetical protein AHiyo4_39690 [Arthrobacter sp. Hiyo4]|nr:hypothetical protein AHiyo4_39690 [Arthrobacter sp. Hiyo4]